jgi:nicotinamide mononucleotide transporter
MNNFEIFAAAVGFLYLWLEYSANTWLWLVGIVMPLCYIYIFYESKFYAGMTINAYYLFANIYGWRKWKRNNSENSLTIRHIPAKNIWILTFLSVTLFVIIAFILTKFTDSEVIYSDSFINSLSITGMWMLAHKYIEQWWVWLVVNVVSAEVYYVAGLRATAVMYAAYAIVSLLGYYNWKKIIKAESVNKERREI